MERKLLAFAIAASAVAGCGSGSEHRYSAQATAECLTGYGASVDPAGADYIAQSASAGAYLVNVDGKLLNLSFGRDADEAKALLKEYESVGGDAAVYREGNAVLVWDDDPGIDRDVVKTCLT